MTKIIFLFFATISIYGTSFAKTTCPATYTFNCLGPPCSSGGCTTFSGSVSTKKPATDQIQIDFDKNDKKLQQAIVENFAILHDDYLDYKAELAKKNNKKISELRQSLSELQSKNAVKDAEFKREMIQKSEKDKLETDRQNIIEDSGLSLNVEIIESGDNIEVKVIDDTEFKRKCRIGKLNNLSPQKSIISSVSATISNFAVNKNKLSPSQVLTVRKKVFLNKKAPLYMMDVNSSSIFNLHNKSHLSINQTSFAASSFVANIVSPQTIVRHGKFDASSYQDKIDQWSALSMRSTTELPFATAISKRIPSILDGSGKVTISQKDRLRSLIHTKPASHKDSFSKEQNIYNMYNEVLNKTRIDLIELDSIERIKLLLATMVGNNN